MPTAQEALGDAVVAQISPSGHIAAINKFAPGIVEFVSTTTQTLNGGLIGAPASHFSGSINPFFTHVSGNPWKEYLVLPSTIAAGDKVKINIDGVDHEVDLPASFSATGTPIQYDGDRINLIIANAVLVAGAGDDLGGPIVNVNQNALGPGQRGLVVYEHQPATAGGGKMFVIHPNQAAGIPLPAFRTVTAVPATGTLIGEAVLNTTTGLSYVWDGLNWTAIVPPSIVSYPTDADVLNDAAATAGTYAFSVATGNLFVRFNDGANDVWREIGIMKFPTEAGLLAHNVADGSIAYAVDSGNYWVRIGTTWETFGVNQDTEAQILASTRADGSISYAIDTDRFWIHVNSAWQPLDMHSDTEANLLASTPRDGTSAYATDTNVRYVRVNGAWQPESIIYDTDANILALTAQDNQLAVSTDAGTVYLWENGGWIALTARHFPDIATMAAWTPSDGQQALVPTLGLLYVRASGAWYPKTVWHSTDAGILARTDMISGQIAVASDTNKMYTWDGARWVGQPFRTYATEVALDAATPPDGVVAVAADNGIVGFRAGGIWIKANRATNIIVQETQPSVGTLGNMWFKPSNGVMQVYDGTNWTQLTLGVIADLGDVSAAAPLTDQILTWDGVNQWYPGNNPSVKMAAEPAAARRWPGMLWWHDGKMWVWDSAGVWVET